MDQLSFASLDFAAKKKRTKRDVFLAEMGQIVPWGALEAVIEPHYPKMGPQGGRRPFPLAAMLRIYCLQQWYNLSDPGAEEALYDIQSMRAFAGLELCRDADPRRDDDPQFPPSARAPRPDEGDLRGRRRAPRGEGRAAARRHHRGRDADRGLAFDEERSAEARSRDDVVEEGKPVVFRHEGAHRRRCRERARAHGRRDDGQGSRREGDGQSDPRGRHGRVRRQGLRERREEARGGSRRRQVGREGESQTWPRPHEAAARENRRFGKVRAKVEHVFRVVKCQFGYRKVRYRGIAKNGAQVFALFALANLYLVRGRLASA